MRILFLALTLLHGPISTRAAHPVDGPDVDVRLQIVANAVKLQVIMNLAYVDAIVEVPREDEWSIQPGEHAGLRAVLYGFYKKSNKLKIDGLEVTPIDKDFEVRLGDPDLLPLFPKMKEKALWKVQLNLEYPCQSRPSRVSIAWGEFPIDPVVSTPEGPRRIEIEANLLAKGIDELVKLTPEEPEYTWHDSGETVEDRFLAVPEPPTPDPLRVSVVTGALGLIGLFLLLGSLRRRERALRFAAILVVVAGSAFFARDLAVVELPNPFDPAPPLPSVAQAEAIFAPLHRNIYRAFDYVEAGEVYDALARSVDGALLDDLYAQVYRSLIMHEEGGAVSRVRAVRTVQTDVESVGLMPSSKQAPGGQVPGFQVHARWQVDGVVRHWNHAHYRTNEYEARYTVVQAERGWRIAAQQVIAQRRIDDGSDMPPADEPTSGPKKKGG